jgi:polysaccharide export outer membrane protein
MSFNSINTSTKHNIKLDLISKKGLGILKTILLLVAISMIMSAGCAHEVKNPTAINYSELPKMSIPTEEYIIHAGDLLDIKFFYNPELNEQIIVRPDGRISLQLAKEIYVAGLTPAHLTDQLTKTYSTELDNPEITVIVRSFSTQRVYVDGEVNKPGLLELVGATTILQSISMAGGLKDTAKTCEVIIIRRDTENKVATIVVNIEKVLNGVDSKQDIVIKPQDIIFVPKSHIAKINEWVDQYLRKNIPVSFGMGVPI